MKKYIMSPYLYATLNKRWIVQEESITVGPQIHVIHGTGFTMTRFTQGLHPKICKPGWSRRMILEAYHVQPSRTADRAVPRP